MMVDKLRPHLNVYHSLSSMCLGCMLPDRVIWTTQALCPWRSYCTCRNHSCGFNFGSTHDGTNWIKNAQVQAGITFHVLTSSTACFVLHYLFLKSCIPCREPGSVYVTRWNKKRSADIYPTCVWLFDYMCRNVCSTQLNHDRIDCCWSGIEKTWSRVFQILLWFDTRWHVASRVLMYSDTFTVEQNVVAEFSGRRLINGWWERSQWCYAWVIL